MPLHHSSAIDSEEVLHKHIEIRITRWSHMIRIGTTKSHTRSWSNPVPAYARSVKIEQIMW